MSTLTVVNRCGTPQAVYVTAGGELLATFELTPGEARTVANNTGQDANVELLGVVPGTAARYRVTVASGVSTMVTVAPSSTGCFPGVGSAQITFTAACPRPGSQPDLLLVGRNASGTAVVTTRLVFPSTAPITGDLRIDPSLTYTVTLLAVGGQQLTTATFSGAELAAAGTLRSICAPTCSTCQLVLGPAEKTGTSLTIRNECKVPVAAAISEVVGGVARKPSLQTIPALGQVVYQASAALVQVGVGGRTVSSSAGAMVTITNKTGFCAPSVGC